jgi:hypothetical protein
VYQNKVFRENAKALQILPLTVKQTQRIKYHVNKLTHGINLKGDLPALKCLQCFFIR